MFCPRDATTVEHALPAWILELLGGKTPRMQLQVGKDTPKRTWFGRKGVRIMRFCGPCNHGWMSDLEKSAKRIVGPLILDLSVSLSREDQVLLAAWGMKTAMVFEGVNSQSTQWFFSDEDRRHLLASSTPPPNTMIWLGRCEQSRGSFGHARRLHGDNEGVIREGFTITFSVGRFVMQILTLRFEPQVNVIGIRLDVTPGPWNQSLVQGWPVSSGPVPWPPPMSFGESGISLEQLSERFKTP
jgi:hypothetical protein